MNRSSMKMIDLLIAVSKICSNNVVFPFDLTKIKQRTIDSHEFR